MNERNYKDDVKINTKDLAGEWERQSDLLIYWHEQWAHAVRTMNWRKEQLRLTDAKIESEIRKSPKEYGLEKVTDSGISSVIARHPEHKEAHNRYIDAIWYADVMEGAKWAMMHKKDALEALMRMMLSGLHLMPHLDGALLPLDAHYEKNAKEGLRKEMKE